MLRNFTEVVERIADNAAVTTFSFIPIIEDDGKKLRNVKIKKKTENTIFKNIFFVYLYRSDYYT